MSDELQRRHATVGTDHLLIEPERLVIRSPVDMLDWQVREFRRIRIDHDGRSWELVAKIPGLKDTVRYELAPWPEQRTDPPGAVVTYDEAYVAARDEARARERRTERAGLGGFVLAPLIGCLPARTKVALEERGYGSALAATRASVFASWVLLLLVGTTAIVMMFAGGLAGSAALAELGLRFGGLTVLLLVDFYARTGRAAEDSLDATGFYEWLWNRKTSLGLSSKHHVDGPGRVWLPGESPRDEPESPEPSAGSRTDRRPR